MRDTYGRHIIVPKLLGTVLVMIWAVCWMPTASAQSGGEVYYVALGDSISSGYGLQASEQVFTSQVASENGYTLISQAENGETSQTLWQRLQEPEVERAVEQADVITVTIGGNDMLNAMCEYLSSKYQTSDGDAGITGEEVKQALVAGDMDVVAFAAENVLGFSASDQAKQGLEQFTCNFNRVVDAIYERNPEVCLTVVNQYDPYHHLFQSVSRYAPIADAAKSLEEEVNTEIRALNAVIDSVGEQTGYAVVDAYSLFAQAAENPCNAGVSFFAKLNLDVHPNAYGHQLMAQAVAQTTNRQLQAMGHESQAVIGQTKQLTQPYPQKEEQWAWIFPGAGGGFVLLGLVFWRCRQTNGRRKT